VAAGYIHLAEVVSQDGATVSQAITYCDSLIDNPQGDHETAKDIAEHINDGKLLPAGAIPLTTANIAYRRPAVVLGQSHPNPFATQTAIHFRLRSEMDYTLCIYNVSGQLVRRFGGTGNGEVVISWDGRDDAGTRLVPGIYFYQLRAGNIVETKRVVLVN
jgi:hypothetical protein